MKREHFSYTADANGYMIKFLGEDIGGASVKLPRDKPLHWRHARANTAENKIQAERQIEGILNGYNTRYSSLIGKIARKNKILPIYTEDEAIIKPGLYLALFHGAKNEKKRKALSEAGEWGVKGPLIGPLSSIHGTYATHLRLKFETTDDARIYGFESKDDFNEIAYTKGGCLEYKGMEYGDFFITNFPAQEVV